MKIPNTMEKEKFFIAITEQTALSMCHSLNQAKNVLYEMENSDDYRIQLDFEKVIGVIKVNKNGRKFV